MNDDLLTSDIDTSSDLVTVATFDDSVSASLVIADNRGGVTSIFGGELNCDTARSAPRPARFKA